MQTFNLYELLGTVFLIQTCLYIAFLTRKRTSQSEYILIAFLSVLVLLIVNLFVRFHWIPNFPYYYYEFVAVLAPLQLLYTQSLVDKSFKLSFKDISHFSGAAAVFIARSLLMSDFIEADERDFERLFFFPLFLYLFVCLFMSFRRIRNFHETILLTRSNFDLYNLKWLKAELYILGIFFATISVESLSLFIDFGNYYSAIVLLSFISVLLFINILTLKSLRAPISSKGITPEEAGVYNAQKIKYRGSSITDDKSKALYSKLQTLMDERKPYTEFRLSLQQLADMLNITAADLSQIVNENANMNFNDFVNSYRIELAKSLIREKQGWLIKEIMYESGFQSSSTFNSAFKKLTGLSPSAYCKQKHFE